MTPKQQEKWDAYIDKRLKENKRFKNSEEFKLAREKLLNKLKEKEQE